MAILPNQKQIIENFKLQTEQMDRYSTCICLKREPRVWLLDVCVSYKGCAREDVAVAAAAGQRSGYYGKDVYTMLRKRCIYNVYVLVKMFMEGDYEMKRQGCNGFGEDG